MRWKVAVSVSVGVHLALLAWLGARPKAPPRPAEALQIEMVVAPAVTAPVQPPPAAASPAAPPREVRRVQAPRPATPPADAPRPAAPPTDARPPADAPVADAPVADVPVADPPMDLSLASARGSLLVPRQVFTDSPDAGLVVTRRLTLTPQESLDQAVRNQLGRGRVERGLVHPYFSQLGKALIKNWDADRAVAVRGISGFIDQAGQNFKAWNGIWQNRAETYAKTGSPIEGPGLDPRLVAPTNERSPTGSTEFRARQALGQEMREQFRAVKRATLRVVQDREGHLKSVELVDPSNDAAVDREALRDVEAAAARFPAPPPEAIGSREELSSLWSFELIISITPPVPTFSFEFDEALGFIDARLPLDRRIYKRVKLVSVE